MPAQGDPSGQQPPHPYGYAPQHMPPGSPGPPWQAAPPQPPKKSSLIGKIVLGVSALMFGMCALGVVASSRKHTSKTSTLAGSTAATTPAKMMAQTAAARPSEIVAHADTATDAQTTPAANNRVSSVTDSPLQAYVRRAQTTEEFDNRVTGNEWVFFRGGVRPCDSDDTPEYMPPGDNEFERRQNESRRADVRRTLENFLVVFHGRGDLPSPDQSSSGVEISGGIEVTRSAYDFNHHRFRMIFGTDTSSRWGICLSARCRPTIKSESAEHEGDRVIGHMGHRSVSVRTTETETAWLNETRFAVDVQIPEEEARHYSSAMPVDVTVVQRFLGLGYHRHCEPMCTVIFGERTCSGVNNGFGLYYESQLVGYEIRVGGNLVAQREPSNQPE